MQPRAVVVPQHQWPSPKTAWHGGSLPPVHFLSFLLGVPAGYDRSLRRLRAARDVPRAVVDRQRQQSRRPPPATRPPGGRAPASQAGL